MLLKDQEGVIYSKVFIEHNKVDDEKYKFQLHRNYVLKLYLMIL